MIYANWWHSHNALGGLTIYIVIEKKKSMVFLYFSQLVGSSYFN